MENTVIRELFKTPILEASDAVLPFSTVEEGSGGISHVGSAILALVGGEGIIVTARHVLQPNGARAVIHGSRRYVQLDAPIARLQCVHGIKRPIDLAYVQLSATEISALTPVRAFELTSTHPDLRGDHGDFYIAIGHPVSRSKNRIGTGAIRTECTILGLIEAPTDMYDMVGAHPELHLLLRYDRDNMWKDGVIGTGPHPPGMSGGAIMRPRPTNRLESPFELDLEGENPVYYVLGQTNTGRYLFCVVIAFPDGNGYPVTARPMTDKEKCRYKQWRKQ